MKNIKKIVALVLAMVLVAGLSVAGTVAYLTDRDAKTNIFTVGNVDISLNEAFGQGAALVPGVEINKVPTITNNGPTDAWVWMTFSIPSALDNFVQGSEQGSNENIIHWNPLGATAEGYVTEERVANAIQQGLLPEGTTADDIIAANKTWNVFNSLGDGQNVYQETIDNISYNTYVLLYNKALTKGETTLPSLFKVYLDAQIDIDPEGQMYRVVKGNATKVEWNIKTAGNPLIHIAAYGIQKDNFATVNDAYAAYNTQWGDNGRAEAEAPTTVTNNAELDAALKAGKTSILMAEGTYQMPASAKGKVLTLTGSGKNTVIEVVGAGQGEANGQLDYNLDGSTVTFNDLTIKTNNQTYAGYARLKATFNNCVMDQCFCLNGDSAFYGCTFDVSGNQYNVWTWGADKATFDNCTFNSDGKAILLYGQANTNLVVNKCTFNDTGVLPDLKAAIEIGNDYNKSYTVTVNDTTVNGYEINDKGINTGSTLWGNKNSMPQDKLNVVDGVDVY